MSPFVGPPGIPCMLARLLWKNCCSACCVGLIFRPIFVGGLCVLPPFLSKSVYGQQYLKKLCIFCLLVLKLALQFLDFFFQAIQIDLQLLLNPYVLSYLRLCLLNCVLKCLIIFADDVAACVLRYMLAACCSLSILLISENRKNSRKATTLLLSSE